MDGGAAQRNIEESLDLMGTKVTSRGVLWSFSTWNWKKDKEEESEYEWKNEYEKEILKREVWWRDEAATSLGLTKQGCQTRRQGGAKQRLVQLMIWE